MTLLSTIDIAFHRNGISGAPFDVVLFEVPNEPGPKVAIHFAEEGCCAILDVAKLAAFDIAFGSNSWRGDIYEPLLRRVIEHSRKIGGRPA